MNRIVRVLVAVGLPVVVVIGFALATNRGTTPPDRGQVLLSAYLNRTAGSAGRASRAAHELYA